MAVEPLLAILMLIGASISDIQTRRVPNRYWIPFVVIAGWFWLERLATGIELPLVIGAAAMTAALYVMWWFGAFGGADAKGLMVLAWLWPEVPDLLSGRILPALDLLINAALIALLFPVAFLLWNIARRDVAFPAMVLGTKMDRERAQKRHVWPMQHATDDGLRWRFWHRPTDDLGQVHAKLRIAGVKRVWVTPKIPFMLPLTAGAVAAWLMGNVVLRFLLTR